MLNKTEIYHIVAEALENALYWMDVGRWDRQTVLTGTAVIINSVYKVKKGINGNLLEDPDHFLKGYFITDEFSYNADRNSLSEKSFLLAEKLLIWTPTEAEDWHKNNLWMGGEVMISSTLKNVPKAEIHYRPCFTGAVSAAIMISLYRER